MLTDVTIHHFRSCREVTLSGLGAIVALVGRNGAGKSNILQAIRWAASTAVQSNVSPEIGRGAVTLGFRAGPNSYRYSIRSESGHSPPEGMGRRASPYFLRESLELQTPLGWEAVLKHDDVRLFLQGQEEPVTWLVGQPALRVIDSLPEIGPYLQHVRRAIEFLRRVTYHPLDEANEPKTDDGFIDPELYKIWREYGEESIGRPLPLTLPLLHLYLTMRDRFEEAQAILGPEGLGLLIGIEGEELRAGPIASRGPRPASSEAEDASSAEQPPVAYRVRFAPAVGEASAHRYLPYESLSLGTRRIIRLIVALVSDDNAVLLVEHPEDGIHRGLMHKVFDLMRTYTDPAQVIVASHSAVVLDALNEAPDAVRLVTMEDGETRARALTTAEVQSARRYIEDEGALSDFLQSRFDI